MNRKINVGKVYNDGKLYTPDNTFINYNIRLSNGVPVQVEGFLITKDDNLSNLLQNNKNVTIIHNGRNIDLKYEYMIDTIHVYNDPMDFGINI